MVVVVEAEEEEQEEESNILFHHKVVSAARINLVELSNDSGCCIVCLLQMIFLLNSAVCFVTIVYRTVRWLDRCIAAHKRPNEQNLFPIVQGGLDANLRVQCAKGAVLNEV